VGDSIHTKVETEPETETETILAIEPEPETEIEPKQIIFKAGKNFLHALVKSNDLLLLLLVTLMVLETELITVKKWRRYFLLDLKWNLCLKWFSLWILKDC
jgi:hypothetical protein